MVNGRQSSMNSNNDIDEGKPSFGTGDAKDFVHDDAGLQELFSSRPAHYSAKDVIYNEGAVIDTVVVIRSGIVKLISHLSNGRTRIVRVHSTGSWLGLGGLLGNPYEHTAVAVDEVDAYHIPVSKLLRIKRENPHLYNKLLELWFDYLQNADIWIAEFSTGVVKARVARLVNYLSEISDTASGEVKLLTCEEMAEILGATPESVSRVLAEFKRENVLYPSSNSDGDYYQKNEEALKTISQE